MAFDFEKEHLELARLENLYQDNITKFEKKLDRIKEQQNKVLWNIWNSILEQKSLIIRNGGVLNDD